MSQQARWPDFGLTTLHNKGRQRESARTILAGQLPNAQVADMRRTIYGSDGRPFSTCSPQVQPADPIALLRLPGVSAADIIQLVIAVATGGAAFAAWVAALPSRSSAMLGTRRGHLAGGPMSA